jgi:DMSO/TMAO reductase YedYZ heme-binding membrane subunit
MQPATRSSKQPLGGRSGDWRHRLLSFHVPLALASALVLVLFMTLPLFDANVYPHADIGSGAFPQQRERGEGGPMGHGGDQAGPMGHGRAQTSSSDEIPSDTFLGLSNRGFTVATGYVALGLLALTLLIGSANLLLRRPNPVSTYLARDVGTWAAIASLVHVFYGLQVHGQLRNFLDYFVLDGRPLTNSFGLGNWTGLAATVIVVGLLATSSNFALRKLKARRWKRIQRLNYALFALVIAHAFFYGALLRMTSPFTLLLLLSAIAVFVGQAVGVWLWRQRHARTTAGQRGRQSAGATG